VKDLKIGGVKLMSELVDDQNGSVVRLEARDWG